MAFIETDELMTSVDDVVGPDADLTKDDRGTLWTLASLPYVCSVTFLIAIAATGMPISESADALIGVLTWVWLALTIIGIFGTPFALWSALARRDRALAWFACGGIALAFFTALLAQPVLS